jgi:hypothetical protein
MLDIPAGGSASVRCGSPMRAGAFDGKPAAASTR